ncbi:Transthyretin-like family protein [Caenorhabditis elegans]|uniref:Transthyretin-like family protein n=1 Tax=Caenorhabditis elegans TaxID=6239 RepID=H2KYJ2_CAEEL|nr:Transthyretin-like family protein [Caenorhabditis elegans]CCD63527.1 Transthyretin-like family protein [Caenorhabditis elegans]|eukprot:NP_001123180.1 TransThyretin-Related family domain [Caenorhabditis elegans]
MLSSTSIVLFFATISCCSALLFGLIGSEQSVAVTGKLTCNGEPAAHVRVKLYEKETTLDVLLDEGTTDENGEFKLQGHKVEVSTIDPKLNIYHKCNYKGICYQKSSLTIPDNFVTEGEVPQKTFNVGIINLANKFSGDSTDCLN